MKRTKTINPTDQGRAIIHGALVVANEIFGNDMSSEGEEYRELHQPTVDGLIARLDFSNTNRDFELTRNEFLEIYNAMNLLADLWENDWFIEDYGYLFKDCELTVSDIKMIASIFGDEVIR